MNYVKEKLAELDGNEITWSHADGMYILRHITED